MQRSPAEGNIIIIEKKEDGQNVLFEKKTKRFNNGWDTHLETLAAEWADKAGCYRWMHEKTETRYVNYNMYLTIPVIVLSTLTGTASFGFESLLSDPCKPQYTAAVIGGVSLITGMISAMGNFLRYAQSSEAHRIAAISWGKFNRFITTEMALHPKERMDSMSFVKSARLELDRLIEQSPLIPDRTIKEFKKEFKTNPHLVFPEIAGGLQHTKVFVESESEQKKEIMSSLLRQEFLEEVVKVAQETALNAVHGAYSEHDNTAFSPNQIVLEVNEKI
jgi:hypothetical protein